MHVQTDMQCSQQMQCVWVGVGVGIWVCLGGDGGLGVSRWVGYVAFQQSFSHVPHLSEWSTMLTIIVRLH